MADDDRTVIGLILSDPKRLIDMIPQEICHLHDDGGLGMPHFYQDGHHQILKACIPEELLESLDE